MKNNATILNTDKFQNLLSKVYKIDRISEIIKHGEKHSIVNAFCVNGALSENKIITMPFSFLPRSLGYSDDIDNMHHLVNIAQSMGDGFHVEYKSFHDIGDSIYIKEKKVIKSQGLINSSLALQKSYEHQQSLFSKSLRQTIRTCERRAIESKVEFVIASNINQIKSFYLMLVKMFRDKHHTISQPFEIFEAIYNDFVPKKMANFYLAIRDNKVIAGVVVFSYNSNWTYMWGASDQEYAKLSLNTLLVNRVIRDAVNNGAVSLDFGPSDIKNKSLIKFKDKWGCKQEEVFLYYWNRTEKNIGEGKLYFMIRKIIPYVPLYILKKIPKYVAPILV
jgi:hypothetical protein